MKQNCKVCGATGKTAEFYKCLNTKCKDCHKAAVKKNREDKVEYYRQYDAKRFQEDPKVRERHRRYQKTEAGKKSMRKSQRKWLENNPEKRAAHLLLNNAVRDGRISKPDTCSKCGSGGRIDGHHHDYTKPLDVAWLCRTCHVSEHK